MKSNSVSSLEYQVFVKEVVLNRRGRFQHREGVKDKVSYYAIVNVSLENHTVIGHISSEKSKLHFTFEITLGEKGIRIAYTPDADCGAHPSEVFTKTVAHALYRMVKKSKVPAYSGPMDTSNWKGFYLWSDGPNKNVDLSDLEEAVLRGVVTEPFAKSCRKFGYHMRKINC